MRSQAVIAMVALSMCSIVAQEHEHHHPSGAATVPDAASQPIAIPDVELVNQRGEKVHFYSDLVKGKTVAIQTIFTSCTTICPPMGATWGRLQTLLKGSDPARFNLISISIDPQIDTPQRLLAWGAQFHAGPEWTLLTGSQPEIDRLLKALRLYTPDKLSHTPLAIVGSDGGWQYVDVLKSQAPVLAATMRKSMESGRPTTGESEADAADHRYFTDVMLIDQSGKQMRLYSDVMKGRVVVINEFFTSCTDSCPMMAAKFARLQEWLGPRLGKDVFLVSLSVDPANDTPEKLRAYAARFKARPGWIFLTGSKQNVDFALGKLGPKMNQREDHTTVFLIGNMNTHLWKKAKGTASVEAIAPVLQSVLDDRG
jgi:protein SCO1